jgi:hypothetical protein
MSSDAIACFNDGCKVVVRNMVVAVKLCGKLDRQGTFTADERGSGHVEKMKAKLGTARSVSLHLILNHALRASLCPGEANRLGQRYLYWSETRALNL